ncbi:glycosyltransferase [Filimonas effusa]|uniref:Glycosyltransferase n=1 Tax=Filimonas effusa TaxID=2508721 RepID=A0A4Q1DBH9_9BACT|nr:glycosyltransferase [Filimonas effusa]RXK86811.1 glycosyltransferase [Filimonas effusa]
MKVAFCIRQDYDTMIGGDSIQLLKTREHLEKSFPVTIDIVTRPEDLHTGYDLVHIFNLATRDTTLAFLNKANALQLKIALSTIFWNYTYQAGKDVAAAAGYNIPVSPWQATLINGFSKLSAAISGKPRMLAAPFRRLCRESIGSANILLPNSIEELGELARFTGLPFTELEKKTQVVVNAASFSANNEAAADGGVAADDLNSYNLPEKFLLQIGRIEYVKNQLNLVRALYRDTDIAIVFIGKVNDEKYYRKLKQLSEARGNVFFIDHVPHDRVNAFYKRALLHVLPSFRESPGLVSLEALANECKVVVSQDGFAPVRTYFFDKYATVIHPASLPSIRAGVLAEIRQQRDMAAISADIRAHFNWEKAAEQTFSAYRKICPGK